MSRLEPVRTDRPLSVWGLAFWAYLAGASLLLLLPLPFDVDRAGPAGTLMAITGVRASTVGHLFLYTLGALLAGFPDQGRGLRIALLVAHGPLTEYLQGFVPQRTTELGDLFADWAGLILGVFLVHLVHYGLRWRTPRAAGADRPGAGRLRQTRAAGGVGRPSADAVSTS